LKTLLSKSKVFYPLTPAGTPVENFTTIPNLSTNAIVIGNTTDNIEIFIDELGLPAESSKNVLSVIKSQRDVSVTDASNLKLELETVKSFAEFQAPEIHFPAKKYLLQSFEELTTESYLANVWVVLLENFRDNTIRAIVYDEKQNEIEIPAPPNIAK
jgi:hypothetical protein